MVIQAADLGDSAQVRRQVNERGYNLRIVASFQSNRSNAPTVLFPSKAGAWTILGLEPRSVLVFHGINIRVNDFKPAGFLKN